MGMGHDHSSSETGVQTATAGYRRRMFMVLGIYAGIITAELIGSWLTNSLALMAEAMHMAVDGSGILIALIATYLAVRKPNKKRTYGLMRAEIIAVLINCLLLFGLGIYVLTEAVERWFNPPEVEGGLVIVFAVVGMIGASISLVLLSRGAKESLNVKAAFLEVMSDGIGATAIVISGILNVTLGWKQGDAIAAAAIGVIILPRAFMLLRQAINIILQGAPAGIEMDKVEAEIASVDGVEAVHSVHVWALTSGVSVMSAHVVVDEELVRDGRSAAVLDELTERMRHEFRIEHSTFQLEEPGHLEHEGAMHRDLAGVTTDEERAHRELEPAGHSH
ncbi:MAG: cation transporter [Leifsonia xyli]|nr:MAG: cation transporter [Leifsonia xyli]